MIGLDIGHGMIHFVSGKRSEMCNKTQELERVRKYWSLE